MHIKRRTLVIVSIILVVLAIAEWYFAFTFGQADGRADAAHRFHGLCNSGVGMPYQEFMHNLRVLADSGDTNKLTAALHTADQCSRDIFEVWLAYNPDAYKESIQKILP